MVGGFEAIDALIRDELHVDGTRQGVTVAIAIPIPIPIPIPISVAVSITVAVSVAIAVSIPIARRAAPGLRGALRALVELGRVRLARPEQDNEGSEDPLVDELGSHLDLILPTMELVRLQCPACGAELPPRTLDHEIVCQYCDSRFEAVQARSAKTVAGVVLDAAELLARLAAAAEAELSRVHDEPEPDPEPDPEEPQTSGPSLLGQLLSAAIKLAVIAVVLGVVLLVLISQGVLSLTDIPVLRDIPALRTLVEDVVDDRFDPHGGAPVLVEIDGQPAAVVRMRRTGSELLFVAAFALPSGEKLWQLGPIDTHGGSDPGFVRFTSVGPFVVFGDASGRLYVHDLETGNLLRSLDAKRPVDALCAVDDDEKPRVLVVRSDDRLRIFDPEAGELKRIKQAPPGCATHQLGDRDPSLVDPERVRDRLDDFEPVRTHLVDDRALVSGHDESERGAARVVAVPHKGGAKARVTLQEPLWNVAVTEGEIAARSTSASTIAGEHLVVDWREPSGTIHLAGFGLNDGVRAWDVALEATGGAELRLHGDARFLLVARNELVEIREPSTGELLGTL